MTDILVSRTYDTAGNIVSEITRPETPADVNGPALRAKAQQALVANAAYLAIPAPTAAEVRAQTELLTREVNGLIRLLLNQLDDISDT